MRWLFLLSIFLLGSSSYSSDTNKKFSPKENKDNSEPKEREFFGVLVQVTDKSILKNKKLTDLIEKNNFESGSFYKSLNVQELNSKTDKKEDLLAFCKNIKKIKGVKICEINYRLKPQNSESDDCVNCTDYNQHSAKEAEKLASEVLETTKGCALFSSSKETNGLSEFWAQEYTGADLLRENLEKLGPLNVPENLIGVWDSSEENHGEQVSHLIAGPYKSAIIPKKSPFNYVDLVKSGDWIRNYEKEFERCQSENNCPRYINNSMYWNESEIIGQAVSKIHAKGTVFITAAGNKYSEMDNVKHNSAKKDHVIAVASSSPSGFPSKFTSYSSEVTISAPSDYFVRSYQDSKPVQFGGTSGAAPQVTSALAAFELISDYQLSTKEAKVLLKKTATPFGIVPNATGAGMLNAYKIGMIAFKLKELCLKKANPKKCMEAELAGEELYSFKDTHKDTLKVAQEAFPGCSDPSSDKLSSLSCTKQKDIFIKLRKLNLLHPSEGESSKLLACLSFKQGLDKNAKFYEERYSQSRLTADELFEKLVIDGKSAYVTNYALSHDSSRVARVLNKIVSSDKADKKTLKIIRDIIPDLKISSDEKKKILALIKEKEFRWWNPGSW